MNTQASIILALDTSMSACCAGLYRDGKTLAERHEIMNRGQAERLVPMIDELIKESHIHYNDIDLIACTHGPGAFTGLRLSLATAKALSLGLDIPCVGISTLESIYETIDEKERSVLVCLETKRKDFYSQSFETQESSKYEAKSRKLSDIQNILSNDNYLIIGDANARLGNETNLSNHETIDVIHPKCHAIANLALKKFQKNGQRLQNMEPLYLRDADVSFPATKK